MTIKAIISGEELELQLVSYSDEGFKLSDSKGLYEDILLSTPLTLNCEFSNKEFEVFFLAKKDILENHIYQIYDDSRKARIGWCIPVNALDSADHDFADNVHFQKYAFAAIKNSISSINDSIFIKKPDLSSSLQLRFSDLFHPSTAILIISKETLLANQIFEIERVTPSLIRHGYVRLTNTSPDDITLKGTDPEGDKIHLKVTSSDLGNHQVIDSLLHSAFAYETKPLLCFFYIYQIFELLLEEIYQTEQSRIVDDLIIAAGDSSKAKEALEKAQRISSEKKRIGLLATEYSKQHGTLANLKTSCNILLKLMGRSEGTTFEEYFYSIRNFLFHQYRDFPSSQEQLLKDVIYDVRECLPGILCDFKKPIKLPV
ncbi:hypothetical protein NLO85_02145 [Pseudomonas savastanoi]|uniref:ApeA N-terminal domain-containing protein n=2 Tax=Pseudomonas savastanoi TaxID=29438 RepID=A0AAW5J1G7_PSESS|nr:hypothetical protein [Pseudomonas savastanoi]KPY00718.1 hypothetical protein ALO61_200069 [Pseudomonas savastanoi pv. nerii]KWS46775.1 hypothetical protein AL058_19625 [Pseudomonas savastanoi pv. nerii]MCQ3019389.1 hypothetical protein [Pseudomonas savastanoi]